MSYCLLSDFSLVDVWRKLNPHCVSFTWSNSDYMHASHLDRFFISHCLFKHVCSNKVLPCAFSDHDFVDFDLSLDDFSNKRGSVWRLNTALFGDADFRRELSSVINCRKNRIADFETLGLGGMI